MMTAMWGALESPVQAAARNAILATCGEIAKSIRRTASWEGTLKIGAWAGILSCVAATALPAGAGAAGTQQDTIIVGAWQQPRGFLDTPNNQAIVGEIALLYRPHFVVRRNFGFQPNPVLVDGDLPTFANGGARYRQVTVKKGEPIFNAAKFLVEPAAAATQAKQLIVTGRIKRGLKWEDGQPLTAHDFVFAWQKSCEKDSSALDVSNCPFGSVEGASGAIASYEAKDDTTLELTFTPNAIDPVYQMLVFEPDTGGGGEPQPEHLLKGLSAAAMASDQRATGGESAVPIGYGPYRMTAWKKGDSVSFEANPNWAGAAPKTRKITYRFFTDATAMVNALAAGEIDATSVIAGLLDDQLPYVESLVKRGQVRFSVEPNAASFEYMQMNFNDPADKTFGKPHPVLSEYAVRKAISMALDRKKMVDEIYYGHAAIVDQPQLPQMKSYNLAWGKIVYDPAGAKRLLDEAGWKPGADGIRVKNGVRAKLNLLTTSGSSPRQKSVQIIQANLKDLGIDVATTFQPSSVVFTRDGVYGRNFDLVQFARYFTVSDPGAWFFTEFSCDQTPTPSNGFTGNNLSGWCNPSVSNAAAHQDFMTLDDAERAKDWETIVKAFFSPPTGGNYKTGGYPVVPLHTRPNLLATSPGLKGAAIDPTEFFTWNVETWTLSGE
jgi:peptide/nickel transport system substrate-binding protein